MTSLSAGSRARVMPCADHFGVAQDRRAAGQSRARGRNDVVTEHDMLRRLDKAAGMDHADGDLGLRVGEARRDRPPAG